MSPTPSPAPSTRRLSAAELAAYQRDGFVLLGKLIDDDQLAGFHREEAWLRGRLTPVNGGPETGNITIFRSQVLPYAPSTRTLALGGRHIDAMSQLIGPDVTCWYSQFVTKLPDGASGRSEFPWHQDNGYARVEPGTNVTVWVALDDVDERNGCVWVVPGSHRNGLLPHAKPSAESWHLTVPVEGQGVPVRLRAGEAVAFSALTLHRSLLNRTDAARRAFFLEYADANAVVYHAESAPQPVCERNHSWLVRGNATLPPR